MKNGLTSLFFQQNVWWYGVPFVYECNIINSLQNDLALFSENDFTLFDLKLQATFAGSLNADSKLLLIPNHLFLLFKIYIYNSRGSESWILDSLIREIIKVKSINEKIFNKK